MYPEDNILLNKIESDPEQGLKEAMELYGRAVNTICSSILLNCDTGLVDEAVSTTFFKLWKKGKSFCKNKGCSLKSYLYSIARNTAIDLWRKHPRNIVPIEEVEETELVIEVEKTVQEKELHQILQASILELGEPDSYVFLEKYFFQKKNKEIAEKLNLPVKKVENILYRGKNKLREILEKRGITKYEA